MAAMKTIVNVFVGCCSSAFLMEILMARTPDSANLITFLQFLFIAVQGFIVTSKFGTVSYLQLLCYQLVFMLIAVSNRPTVQYFCFKTISILIIPIKVLLNYILYKNLTLFKF